MRFREVILSALLLFPLSIQSASSVEDDPFTTLELPFHLSISIPKSFFSDRTTGEWLAEIKSKGVEIYTVDYNTLQFGVEPIRGKSLSRFQKNQFLSWTNLLKEGEFLGLYTPHTSPVQKVRGNPKIFLPRDAYRLIVMHEFLHYFIDQEQPEVEILGEKVDRYNMEKAEEKALTNYKEIFNQWMEQIARAEKGKAPKKDPAALYSLLEESLHRWVETNIARRAAIDREELAIDGFLFLHADQLGLSAAERYDLYYTLRFEIALFLDRYKLIQGELRGLHYDLQQLASVGCQRRDFPKITKMQSWTKQQIKNQVSLISKELSQLTAQLDQKNAQLSNLILGDLNHDGKLNSLDHDLFSQLLSSPKEHPWITEFLADMNGDETVDNSDQTLLEKGISHRSLSKIPWPGSS